MPTLSRLLICFLLGNAGNLGSARAQSLDENSIGRERLAADLQFMASDDLAGRDVGSEGIERAGEYIANRFQELGLNTSSFSETPFQEFSIPGPSRVGPAEQNWLKIAGDGELPDLKLGRDFTPVSLGVNGQFSGELVFAGYGITAPDLGYDDYANIDVEGKVVVVLRKEPQQSDPQSRFDGTGSSQYAFFTSKELNAAVHKAAALILVNDGQTVERARKDELLRVTSAGKPLTNNCIPTMYCLRSVIDPLVRKSTGLSLRELELAIDVDLKPRSQLLAGVTVSGETFIESSQLPARNVVGFLPGNGELQNEYVVVGAHYDHVGMGGPGSLAPGTIEVHNGADDNASGTIALLEVARRLASSAASPRRGIIFMAFTGEEKGLLGSKHYVRNPRWPLEHTVAMVNMDMVGRLRDNTLTVYGTGTATTFDAMLERLNTITRFTLDKEPAGFGPSDHDSFYKVQIPVFHFFTGLHNDYHRPSDDIHKVDIPGLQRICELVSNVVVELATAERPTPLINSSVARPTGGPPPGPGARPSPPKAILGIELDISGTQAMVALVQPRGPAAEAGVRPGDVIVAIGNEPVTSITDLRRIMASKKPGDKSSMTVLRAGENVVLECTFGNG